MAISGFPIHKQYTESNMPIATSVPVGTEVFNTTYQVNMKSNGVRWIPLTPFIVYSSVLADQVTGTTSAVTLREFLLPFKYIGPKGSIRWFVASENTINTNAKVLRVHIVDDTTDIRVYDSTITTAVGGRTISKMMVVAGNEYNFWYSNNNTAIAESSLNPATMVQLNPINFLKLKVMAILANAADRISLTRFYIQINPGF